MPEVIEAGKLRQYVTIERLVETAKGPRGQSVANWQTLYANVPASIEPLSGRQAEIARQLVATASHKITIRYHAGLAPKMRATYQGREFAIGYVGDGDMRKRYLQLTCTEQVDGAT